MDFSLDNVLAAKSLFPGIEIIWLYEFIPPLTDKSAPAILEKIISTASDYSLQGINIELNSYITKDLVSTVHDLGMTFYVWTVNNTDVGHHLWEIGVDGLTTDRPGWLRKKLYG